jgi:hypothetical protein
MENKLIEARQNVDDWLGNVIRACEREQQYIREKGDIADAEIQAPWDLLQEAIANLREEQDADRKAQEDAMEVF